MSLRLCFFGDSICVGQHISVHKTWIHKISYNLEKDLKNRVTVLNSSVNGNTTRMALERMHYDVLSHKPDFLYIQFGMNDCNVWDTDYGCSRVSLKAYIENLSEMVDRAHFSGVQKVFLNTNHASYLNKKLPNTKISYEDSNILYYNALKQLQSCMNKIIAMDVRAYLERLDVSPESYLLEDGIHLNHFGHDLYYDYAYQFIKDKLIYLLD